MYTSMLVTTVVLAVAVVAVLAEYIERRSVPIDRFAQQDTASGIPRVLWTYWDGAEMPPFVADCIESWRRMNPAYKVRVLGIQDAQRLGVDKLRWAVNDPVRTSDFVRLELLERYGGIWFDASILCTAPVDWVQDAYSSAPGGAQLVAFNLVRSTTHLQWPVIENWFLAAPHGSSFVRSWNKEFRRINDYTSIHDYLAAVKAQGVTLQAITDPPYLAQHVAAQVVLQKTAPPVDGLGATWVHRLALFEAEGGPFRYLADGGWDAERAVLLLCSHRDTYIRNIRTMVKFPRNERNVMLQNPAVARCVMAAVPGSSKH